MGAVALKTVQTTATALGWYAILSFAYPGRVRWLQVLACYAASVAMNSVLPANLGTFALLLMFTTIIAGATFAAILGGYAVQKIFYTLSASSSTSTSSCRSVARSTSSSPGSTSIRGRPASCSSAAPS